MARERVADRRTQVAAANAALARAQQRGSASTNRLRAARQENVATARQRDRTLAVLREREAALSAKAAQLEADSPTPATASRAHRLRGAVEATRRDPQLPPLERARELRRLETEIDAARASLR